MQYYLAVLFFILGAAVGSFLNVVILRWPQQQSLSGRSHCPYCKHVLSPLELIPLLSFLFLRGKCLNCKKNISWRYFIMELVTGCLFLAAFFLQPPHGSLGYLMLARNLFFISALIVVFVVDLEHYLILDRVIFSSSVIIFFFNLLLDFQIGAKSNWPYSLSGIAACFIGALPFFLIWYFSKGRFMGFGDVKLAAFLGLALGWPLIGVNIFLAIILGGIVSVVLLARGTKQLNSQIAFGTFLSLAGVIVLYFGQGLLRWYLSLVVF